MNIYPAIDLINGQCVRLHKGSFADVTVYSTDPLEMAQLFQRQGAQYLHVVDLDGAKMQSPQQVDMIAKIVKQSALSVQTGGGIRTAAQINSLLEKGVIRVVLGSIAIKQPQEVRKWFDIFGADKLVLALDVRINEKNQPMLAAQGWQEDTHTSLWELIEYYTEVGLQHVLCTDIARDGTLQGTNISLYKECVQRYPDIAFQASGGVKDLADLKHLAKIPVAGVIIGKALYENTFTLAEALAC